MIRVALVALALSTRLVAFSDDPSQTALPEDGGCPPTDSAGLAWVQDVLTEQVYSLGRKTLWLTHLQGQTVRALGSEAGDGSVCDELYNWLNADQRAELAESDPIYMVTYYQVGDRYLLFWHPTPQYFRASTLTAFDLQLNEIATGIW